MPGWGESPKDVRDRFARLEQQRREDRARQDKALKAASDRIKANEEARARARAHEIVRNNLNRPL